ncbi:rRNA N6-adenosine-methyltransferase ZCCHC4 [Eurosta solidaginis]|uniref:rRNA N6-adenosine-methyltransferase ZCCHC4 n=1 Tax=Eurosta solidaginis TaxID=178769 RepID=UPI003530946D
MESQSKLQIIYPYEEEGTPPHPHCPHGPTLLFKMPTVDGDEQIGAYYACSAHRDKHLCNFYMAVEEVTPKQLTRRYELEEYIAELKKQRRKLKNTHEGDKLHYCLDCNVPLLPEEQSDHSIHEIFRDVSENFMHNPTRFLRPLQNDKVQAQYFFDNRALNFFTNCFLDLGINKVVCIGAPRLHAHLRNTCHYVKSFLLDFDYRMFHFYDDCFAWYNMCNNHFFDDAQRQEFDEFLMCTPTEHIMIFTDPPFGCRTELIAGTLRQITRLYNAINQLPHQPLAIFWIFPYFSEHHVQQEMPHMRMCDYKVNYTNHTSYTNVGEKGRKLGSPVRVFTNIPLELLHLPIEEEYKYCASCQRYTALENRHCVKCNMCPSKNGSTYQHCDLCGCCVKPNYVHCKTCRRCTQAEEHECEMFQANQYCWICLQKGHTEFGCIEWRKHCKHTPFVGCSDKEIICLLCRRRGHNERNCTQRSKYLEEFKFLGSTQVKFKG